MNFLTTARLILKMPSQNDFGDLYRLQSDKNVMYYITNGVRSEKEVIEGLQKAINHFQNHGFSLGSLFLKESHQFIGRAGLIHLAYDDNQPLIEVAYALLPQFWGGGYATEMAKALVSWGSKTLQPGKIVGVVNPQNLASKKVLQKAGLSFSRMDSYNTKPVEMWEIPSIL